MFKKALRVITPCTAIRSVPHMVLSDPSSS
jgi:hypothetical protein